MYEKKIIIPRSLEWNGNVDFGVKIFIICVSYFLLFFIN
jgi:hypothetical protein